MRAHVRLFVVDEPVVDELDRYAVRFRPVLERPQFGGFVVVCRDDQLAAARVRHRVGLAKPVEAIASLHAQHRLQRSVRIVETGMAPFCGRRAWWPLVAVAASGLVAAVRLLPPVLEIRSFHEAGLVSDIIGYPSLTHLLSSLVVLRREQPAFNEALPANIWFFDSAYFEFNAYVGLAGAIVIAIFGVHYWIRHSRRYRPLMVPALAMTAMSLGTVYRIVRASGIPLFDSERYTARMVCL